MGVTKTDYMRGMQCPRMLWLDKHHPEYKVIPSEVQTRLDKGNEFGDKAMVMFGDYVETTTIKADGRLDCFAMIEKTKKCLEKGIGVICEAAFSYEGNYCAVDLLKKVPGGYELYEVKDSPQIEEQFVKDVGFQRWILIKCGINLLACYVVYHGNDESNLFEIEDVSQDAKSYSYEVDDNIWRLGSIKKQDKEYFQQVGLHCEKPYRCWYWEYCRKNNK